MPTTIAEVFAAGGLVQDGIESVGGARSRRRPGLACYLISLTESFDCCNSKLNKAPLAATIVHEQIRGITGRSISKHFSCASTFGGVDCRF
jgi:hypothetical protein